MNVPLLQEIKATILAEPHAFRMDTFTCGTAHCIAGHALIKCGYQIVNPEASPVIQRTEDDEHPWDVASDLIEIVDAQAQRLFITAMWPEDLVERYMESSDRDHRAAVAAERIDRFIQSGGAE